jgi:hypothetical protein
METDLKQFGIPDNFPIVINTDSPDWETRAKLQAPFPAHDVEWRIDRVGKKRGGGIWAKILAYINNRAIMNRLDDVFGPLGWDTVIAPVGNGGFLCTITAGGVGKTDGSEVTNFAAFKGGISGSMKRAGSQWGIGRYLYYLEEGWAQIDSSSSLVTPNFANVNLAKKGQAADWAKFYWGPPEMPSWALPPEGFVRVPGSAVLAAGSSTVIGDEDGTPTAPQVDTDGYATKKQMYFIHGLAKERKTAEALKDPEFVAIYEKYVQWVNEGRERKGGRVADTVPFKAMALTDSEADRVIEVLESCSKHPE